MTDHQIQDGFVYPVRVGWADCDPALIAYTGNIPGFALESIDAWWGHHAGADWYKLNVDLGIGTPFVHMDIDLVAPVTPRHGLECEVRLIRLGKTSIAFQVIGRQDGKPCFSGRFVCVFVNAKTFVKQMPAQNIVEAISPLLTSELPIRSP